MGLGLLGIPGCSWLAPKRLLWIPSSHQGIHSNLLGANQEHPGVPGSPRCPQESPNLKILKLTSPNLKILKLTSTNSPNFSIPKLTSPTYLPTLPTYLPTYSPTY